MHISAYLMDAGNYLAGSLRTSPQFDFWSTDNYPIPHQRKMKLPCNSGEGPLETCLVQVQLTARFSAWLVEETGIQDGTALQVLMDLQPTGQPRLPCVYAADLRYPTFDDSKQEELAH